MSNVSEADARRIVVAGPQAEGQPLWMLATGLGRGGEALNGVAVPLLQDILRLSWPHDARTGRRYRRARDADPGPFVLGDLVPADEAALTAFASSCAHPEVKARIHDVIWERYGKPDHARHAIDALVACAQAHSGMNHWPDLEAWVARSLVLASVIGDAGRFKVVLGVLDQAAGRVLASAYSFAFSAFADVLLQNIRPMRKFAAYSDALLQHWAVTLEWLARRLEAQGAWMHVHSVRKVQVGLYRTLGDQTALTLAVRRHIQAHIDEGNVQEPAIATMCFQHAMSIARDYGGGVEDLLAAAKALLTPAVHRAGDAMRGKGVGVELSVTAEEINAVARIAARAPDASTAIQFLASQPRFTTIQEDAFRASAKEMVSDHPLLGLFPSVTFRDGKISRIANTPDARAKDMYSLVVSMDLARRDVLLHGFIVEIFNRPDVDGASLARALAPASWIRNQRTALFSLASERFGAKDWPAAGCLLAISYEGFLRDLLRATGYHALRSDPDGTTSDELLHPLTRSKAAINLLGHEYLALVRFVLCDETAGWNLRNEVAHGNIHPAAFSPARVLLLALLTVHLTLFDERAATDEGQESDVDETSDSAGPEDDPEDENDGVGDQEQKTGEPADGA